MIIRERPAAWRLFFVLRGSILHRIKWEVATTVTISLLVTLLHGRVFETKITLTPIPFSLIGLALAIFLGFRNSTTYDRWWEGRRLWGDLVIHARSLARMTISHVQPGESALQAVRVRRLIAFTHALRHSLRGTRDDDSARFLPADEAAIVAAAANPPDRILQLLSADLADAAARGQVAPMISASIEDELTALAGVQAGCERLHGTPLPFSYTLLLHRTAHLYCLLLPFGLVDTIGFSTPLVVGLISYTFFGLDTIGDEIEDPFALLPNSLPLDAISRRIEIDLRDALGETDLPEMLQPVDYCLL
ncbi:bestrophin family protein [Rhodocyclus tenuis]|uniref:bestrophin family protein n=1 Tax=Rhodocyclus tenuis TaxID=1066 RepID=UPI0019076B7F|nr:bestrophin family ion channel [Rhodocyclus tenuis]MBK1678945.1 bestrophin [Rhodocyclus tenuis]